MHQEELTVCVTYAPEGPELEELIRGCLEAFLKKELERWEK